MDLKMLRPRASAARSFAALMYLLGCSDDDPAPPANDGGSGDQPCKATGCSAELCADEDIASDCLWKEEFACYGDATCERQDDGQCRWTQTPELTACIDNARKGLRWFSTCGDPVCGPTPTDFPDLDECTTQAEGESCTEDGASCDPMSGCGARLVCAAEDPKAAPGGCPISRARYKRNIHYLSDVERAKLAQQLQSLALATYQYKDASDDRQRLGFILEDMEPSHATDSARDRVDLYGYTSLAVAAIQEQAEQIRALTRELEDLRREIHGQTGQCGP